MQSADGRAPAAAMKKKPLLFLTVSARLAYEPSCEGRVDTRERTGPDGSGAHTRNL